MNRYQTAPLTAGLVLSLFFASIQSNSVHGFEAGRNLFLTASSGFVGFDRGTPVTATWSIVQMARDYRMIFLRRGNRMVRATWSRF